jgi:AcrR family transcriptional regulator
MPLKHSYHHGNLRQTLLDAGIALIGEVGPKGFTTREVARRAGVSHNAPYRHFRDKDDLLAVIAAEGFERVALAMKQSAADGVTAIDRLRLCGCGYVDFALRWPQHFLVMFDLPSALEDDSRRGVVGQNAFQILLDFVVDSQKEGSLPRGDPLPLALMAWSLVHGIAKLAASGHLPYTLGQTLDFASWASHAFVSGMKDLKVSGTQFNASPKKRLASSSAKRV